MAEIKADQNLALKVMRLTRPTFGTEFAFKGKCDGTTSGDEGSTWNLDNILGFDSLTLGECLILPQSFGNIYLGETFMSYVCLHNDSGEVCDHVVLRCDLQTATQRLPLLLPNQAEKTETESQLAPGSSIDHVLSHEVKELGTHILVCEVFYNAPVRGKLNFRKFFKFQVMKPLDVKTKFYNAESEDVFLEAQVQNVTSGHLCLEKVALEPSPMFRMASLNSVVMNKKEVPVFGKINFLQPQDSRQYLFSLTPRNDLRTNYKQLRGATNIGKLDIVWRTNMGDRGRLQTSQLQRISPNHGDIRFNIEKVTNIAILNKVFHIHCCIFNNSDRTLDLELYLENVNKPRMIWSGGTAKKLGLIEPAGSTEVILEVVPQDTGLQTLSGVRLKDTSLMRTYPFDDLCHVYVTADQNMIQNVGDAFVQ